MKQIEERKKKEAEENNEAARLWISGLESVNRKLGLARVFDLDAEGRGDRLDQGENRPGVAVGGDVVGHLGPQPDGGQSHFGAALLDGIPDARRHVEGGPKRPDQRRQVLIIGGRGELRRASVGHRSGIGAEPDNYPHPKFKSEIDNRLGEGFPVMIGFGSSEHQHVVAGRVAKGNYLDTGPAQALVHAVIEAHDGSARSMVEQSVGVDLAEHIMDGQGVVAHRRCRDAPISSHP